MPERPESGIVTILSAGDETRFGGVLALAEPLGRQRGWGWGGMASQRHGGNGNGGEGLGVTYKKSSSSKKSGDWQFCARVPVFFTISRSRFFQ
jgi:hypothetical protein